MLSALAIVFYWHGGDSEMSGRVVAAGVTAAGAGAIAAGGVAVWRAGAGDAAVDFVRARDAAVSGAGDPRPAGERHSADHGDRRRHGGVGLAQRGVVDLLRQPADRTAARDCRHRRRHRAGAGLRPRHPQRRQARAGASRIARHRAGARSRAAGLHRIRLARRRRSCACCSSAAPSCPTTPPPPPPRSPPSRSACPATCW